MDEEIVKDVKLQDKLSDHIDLTKEKDVSH